MEDKKYIYKILEDGYEITIEGYGLFKRTQREPYIPYPDLSYEENAKKHIEILKQKDADAEKERLTIEQLQTAIEEQNTMIIDNTYRVTMLELMQSGISL